MPTVADDHPGGVSPLPFVYSNIPQRYSNGVGVFVMRGVISLSLGVALRVVGIVLDVLPLLVAF